MKNKRLTYISLYSGAGIGCYGFQTENFECIATAEIIKRRLEIQKYNKKCKYNSGYISEDLSTEKAENLILDEISLWENKENLKEVDILIATPPCQGMSVANHKKKNETKRNSLIVESIKLTKIIRPKIFVFENVRTFLNTVCTDLDGSDKKIKEAIELNLGGIYNIGFDILNFKDYGNPSSRTRTLVIGTRKDLHEITPFSFFPDKKFGGTLKDAIGHLSSLDEMGQIDSKDIYHHYRPYSKHMLDWIKDIKEGESAFDNKILKKRPHRIVDNEIVINEKKNGDKYRRCFWDTPAPCIHTRNDILASQSTIHPVDNRVFSIRELMFLMTIPNTIKWSSISEQKLNKMTLEEKQKFLKQQNVNIRQSIGEAVPTVIFNNIAKKIKSDLLKDKLDENKILKIIDKNKLNKNDHLKKFIIQNLNIYSYPELVKIIELSNAKKHHNAAFYTRQDICFSVIDKLPDSKKFVKLDILEPSVGAGSFIPLIINKYQKVKNVTLDVVDIDKEMLQILKLLLNKIEIPNNIKINLIHNDFLLYNETSLFNQYKRYDIVVGNPPFGNITKDPQLLKFYKKNKFNTDTNNIFSYFLEESIRISDYVALIIPKSFLSAPEFNKTRELVSQFKIININDYGEKGFKGVKIETISIVIDTTKKGDQTLISSYINSQNSIKPQSYYTSDKFPYWLLYRNIYFDEVAKKLKFNIFKSFRDRQITKKITKPKGKIRVLKSRNISSNSIINIPGYDTYINEYKNLNVSKYLNKTDNILVPNLTYNPRATFLPKNSITDGSVAILSLKSSNISLSKKDLDYYSSREFTEFYMIARNHGTRSLNIDQNSVFFFGIRR